jgi:hypothetical protein
MSEPIRRQSTDAGCELAPVTCWPLILGAASVVVLGIVAASGLLLADLLRPVAVPVASAPAPIAPESRHVVRPTAPADVAVAPLPPRPPERVVTVKRVIVGEYHPLPPVSRVEQPLQEAPAFVRLARKNRAKPAAARPPKPSRRSEDDLRKLLLKGSREIDLEAEKGAGKKLLDEDRKYVAAMKEAHRKGDCKAMASLSPPIEPLLAKRADLNGLPLLLGKACHMGGERASLLAKVSLRVRRLQARAGNRQSLSPSAHEGNVDKGLSGYLKDCLWQTKNRELLVPPLEQMYQTEPHLLRAELVAALARIEGKEATQALARRAVFDLSAHVREAAVTALRARDLDDARPVFLAGLRHPWSPAADHAALALMGLDDWEAIPSLRRLLDEPEPAAPYRNKEGKWVRKELVRVNHLRNCLLCHAPSTDRTDLVRGPIPTPGEPLPEFYYQSRSRSPVPMVRADIVYLRQDFSAMHAVEKPEKWPQVQRFDYLVRSRELKPVEVRAAVRDAKKQTYPQREAVRYALTSLELLDLPEPYRRTGFSAGRSKARR